MAQGTRVGASWQGFALGKRDGRKRRDRDEAAADDGSAAESGGWLGGIRRSIDAANNSILILLFLAISTAIGLLINVLDFRVKEHEVMALAAVKDNPSGVLYVMDLGRLPDGRHRFDVSYVLVLKNTSDKRFVVDLNLDRLALGDLSGTGEAVYLNRAPSLFDELGRNRTGNGIAWRVVASNASVLAGDDGPCGGDFDKPVAGPLRPAMQNQLEANHLLPPSKGCNPQIDYGGGLTEDYPPDHTDIHTAHYRVLARPDQFLDVSIAYNIQHRPGWWDRLWPWGHEEQGPFDTVNPNDEQVYLGTVLRAHCALGVKVQNGEVRSSCEK